jgi:DNA primase
MPFIDFAALKERILIEDAIPKLDLVLKERNSQWRGPCPICQSGGDRALVITPAKQAFYCFGARTGGDVIALAAHIRDCGMKEAAEFLAGNSTVPSRNGTSSSKANRNSSGTVPEERKKEAARSLQPLTYLQPAHAAVQALGLDEATCEAFGAGYAPKGIMRGRLAIPIHDWDGQLLAYCGRAVNGESPTLIFPNGFMPEEHIFNAHRIGAGQEQGSEFFLVREPLEVLKASKNGIDNIVALLTNTISAEQLQRLAAFMDEKGCETVELY